MFIPSSYTPLKYLFIWPEEYLPIPADSNLLNSVGVNTITTDFDGITKTLSFRFAVLEEVGINIGGLEGFEMIIGEESGIIELTATLSISDDVIFALSGVVRLRFETELIKPITGSLDECIVDDDNSYEVALSGTIEVDSNWNISVESDGLTFEPFAIGNTGLVIDPGEVTVCFSSLVADELSFAYPEASLSTDFRGIFIPSGSIYFPEGFPISYIRLSDAFIGTGGFSGTGSFDINEAEFSSKFENFAFIVNDFKLSFIQNTITEFSINGKLTLPFFNEEIEVEVGLTNDGDFLVSAVAGGVIPTIENTYFSLTLDSLTAGKEDYKFYLELSGALLIKFPGFELPEISVDGLRIYSDGSVSIEGGSIALEQQQIIDLYGFQMEIDSVGFGISEGEINEDGFVGLSGPFVSFSGGVKLTDTLPMGVSANGLRYWFDEKKITLDGIGVSFEIPNVLSFSGYVDLDTSDGEFAGAIKLQLMPVNLEVDAQLIVGTAPNANKYFYISIDAELPFGVPIGATGLAFYGFSGMIENNMVPYVNSEDVKDENGETDWWLWYQKFQYAENPSDSWEYQSGGFGMGVGTTIGTLPDNGFIISTKVGFMILFPGPVIMLQGKGNLLRNRSKLNDSTLFDSLIVFDGNAKTLLANLEMTYELPNGFEDNTYNGIILEANGTAEGLFDFDNMNNWHIYLGEEDEDKRIKAEILDHIFKAESYLMLDPDWMRVGAYVGFEKEYKFKVVKVYFSAWIYGKAAVSWAPQQLEGELGFDGEVGLSICDIDFNLSVEASVGGEVPTPKKFYIDYKIELKLPWPLKDIEIDGEISIVNDVPPDPVDEIIQETHIRDYKTSDSWALSFYDHTNNYFEEDFAPSDAFTEGDEVPLDSRPIIIFNRNLKDVASAGLPTPNPQPEKVGEVEFSYKLESLVLQKWDGENWGDPLEINGSWQATGEESGTEIEIQGDGPFSFTRETITSSSEEIVDNIIPSYVDSFLSNFGPDSFPVSESDIEWILFNNYDDGQVLGRRIEIDGIVFSGFKVHTASNMITGEFFDAVRGSNKIGIELIFGVKENRANEVEIEFPDPAYLYEISLYTVFGCTYEGRILKSDGSIEIIDSKYANDGWIHLQRKCLNVKSVIIKITESELGSGNTCYLYGIGYNYEYNKLSHEASRICSETRYTFEPNSEYRITIGTKTYRNGIAEADAGETKYAFFKTGNPPEDLSPYIDSVVFSNNGNPHYCFYNIKINFNENYINQMYNGLLKAKIYDQNGLCVSEESESTFDKGEVNRPYYLKAWYQSIKEVVSDVNCEDLDAADDLILIPLNIPLPPKQLLEIHLEYNGINLWSCPFITSGYDNFNALINDFRNEPWSETLPDGAILSIADGEEFETIYFDQLLLTSTNIPEHPELTLLKDKSEEVILIHMDLSEPVDWGRVTFSINKMNLLEDGTYEEVEPPLDYQIKPNSDFSRFIIYQNSSPEIKIWDHGYYKFTFEYDLNKDGFPELSKGIGALSLIIDEDIETASIILEI